MDAIFLKIVNMSISACWIVLAIILLRVVLKKAPKWINCVLWGIAGLRLVIPFSFESVFSLIPSAETITKAPDSPRPQINSGVTIIDNQINGYLQGNYFEGVTRPARNFVDISTILAIIWFVGIAALLIYTLISFLRLKRKIGTAILLRDNIYQSDAVVSPFVLGIIKPKIYLPFNMNDQDMDHVIAHEQAHIRRRDHLWKPLGFLILTLHWFNPMVWLGYILLCRDIELACDEKVVKELDNEQRADYSEALLACSVNRRMIAACPLAFGEVGVKDRIKSVLNYKKPAFWVIIVAVIASITVAVCFLTNPVNSQINSKVYKAQRYYHDEVIGAERANDEDTDRRYHISEAFVLSMYYDDGMNYQINHQGILIKQKNYNPEITSLILDKLPSRYNQEKIKEVYFANDHNQLTTPKDLYVLLKFTNGDLIMSYLPYGNNGYYAMEVLKIKPLALKTQLHSLSHITGTKGSTDCEGVTVKIIEALYFAENPYIKVQWENNTGKDFLYGEMFRLYKYKNEIKTPVDITIDNLAWHSIGYISKSKTDEKVFSLKYFDLSDPGIYILEFDFSIGDDTATDYTAVLEFEIADTPATIEPVSTSEPAITPDTPVISTPETTTAVIVDISE